MTKTSVRTSQDNGTTRVIASSVTTTPEQVLWYIPNIIGYMRVLCTISSFVIMLTTMNGYNNNKYYYYWRIAIALYIFSFVGDLIDGIAARYYNQCSTFGGVLDMITDRCSTAGLLFILACEYNNPTNLIILNTATTTTTSDATIISFLPCWFYTISYIFLMLLDISSHWVQMYSSLAVAGGAHHKSDEGNKDKNFLVRWFYKYYWFFGYLCVGAEFTYILMYVRMKLAIEQQHIDVMNHIFSLILQKCINLALCICIPGMLAKQVVNIAQLCSSCYAIAKYDAQQATKNKTN